MFAQEMPYRYPVRVDGCVRENFTKSGYLHYTLITRSEHVTERYMHAQHLEDSTSVHETFEQCRMVRETCESQFLHARQMLRSLAEQATSNRERKRIEVMIECLENRFIRSVI